MGSFREGADMAGKKHRGLGRGLDALIPMAKEKSEDSSSARPEESPEASGTAESGSANREQTNSDAGKRAAGSPRSVATSAKPVEAADKPASGAEIKGVGTVRLVRVSKIEPDRNQPRKNFNKDSLEELAQSIKEHGLRTPLESLQDRRYP